MYLAEAAERQVWNKWNGLCFIVICHGRSKQKAQKGTSNDKGKKQIFAIDLMVEKTVTR
jgi:hypothetical protein